MCSTYKSLFSSTKHRAPGISLMPSDRLAKHWLGLVRMGSGCRNVYFFSLFCTWCTAKVPCVDHHEHRYTARTRRQYHASAKYEGRQDSAPRINNPYIETRRTSWFTGVQIHVDVRAHQIKPVSLSQLKKKQTDM